MLRRRSSNLGSDSCFSSIVMEKIKNPAFFNVPSLFVGFTGKGLQDSDSAKSPTSPLDHRLLSNLSSSFVPSPRRSPGKCWDCSRVGLGLVDSLSDEKGQSIPDKKNIFLGSQMRIVNIPSPKSTNLSSNLAAESLFSPFGSYEKIESCTTDKAQQIYHNPKPGSDVFVSDSKGGSNLCSLPTLLSGSLPVSTGSIMGSLSTSEIELSEDYTCIISHGPNPKTTHIFGECILENFVIGSVDSKNKQGEEEEGSHWIVKSLENSPSFPANDFLSFCCLCRTKLEPGKDIYMYRGEKAFCSFNCREKEIAFEEELMEVEKSPYDSPSSSFFHEDLFL